MNPRVTLVAVLVAATIASTACGSSQASPPASGSTGGIALAAAHLPRASADPGAANDVAAAINAFGLDLYAKAGAGGGNFVVSPASIAIALSMARAGAKGETAAQMDRVLHALGADAEAAGLNALDAALTARTGSYTDSADKPVDLTLRIANATFAQRDLAFVPAYLDALATQYGAGLQLVDYRQDAEAARQLINGWVSGQTAQRIPELLAPGVLDAMTRLALVNAIYLKAPWLTPFDADATKAGSFTRADGSTVQAQMMSAGEQFGYAAGTGWRAVDLPYVGGSLSLTVIVPDDIATFERSLSGDVLAQITGSLETQQVELTLPKFDIETKTDLAKVLGSMGMADAFDPDNADFSGITTQERLSISNVIHQANITIDEKGTEAAAATAVVMRVTAAPASPVSLTVDHPFLFALRDGATGAVLFLGRVDDPTATRT